ncbi:type II glyceraldehyde-3-phosphate dehydrogenase [Sinanaerobacter chloroacetimidivorans]|uniref:Type II glyceraldehyde-3-phosphate dehydrogenase n=1 Tax=Sinanaerobacter chloroacetimidivorans TaxID=2818044 RepID=A0A8J7W795_9FIRM|nr:type II glyceraldehyde-3-phosphate dehydrogenase [Sinanaerobacter chloroacetimidivorans]MBR0600271.1 type II glyceraldehyde-3-phosphate dehydrogenase [Sinanaerobacter chloroacetimidivorans]
MVKVLVVGYGVIGQRLADGVALQKDMELVGVVDAAVTLSTRSLKEKGMPYKLYAAFPEAKEKFEAAGIPVSGLLTDVLNDVDIVLDATTGGVGAKNKALYAQHGKKAIFQGGEKNEVADVFFHGYANYEKGLGADFLKLTSCNTTGLIRAVDCLDRKVGIEKVAITIVRRVADPGDYHRGLTNALQVDKAPSHQALDLMTIMPHVDATGILVHTPVTHGHFITVVATPKKDISAEEVIAAFKEHDRIRVVRLEDGFLGNASIFKYARDLGRPRGDLYEICVWEDTVVKSGKDVMFGIHIPQESVTIPESIDGIRAALEMQTDRLEAVETTNKYLGLGAWK